MTRQARPVLPPIKSLPVLLFVDPKTAAYICGNAKKLDQLVDAAPDPSEGAPAVLHFIRVEGLGLMQLVRVSWRRGAVEYRYAIAGQSKKNAETVVKLVSEGQRGLLIGMTPFVDPKLVKKACGDAGEANAVSIARAIETRQEACATA